MISDRISHTAVALDKHNVPYALTSITLNYN